MRFRKLDRREHQKTRSLYEEVFSEDEPPFVDYYYTWKTKENQIFVAEDEQGIHSMVHLNPVEICWNGRRCMIDYIVAVATQEKWRHQGLMRTLLQMAMEEMNRQQRPFTFLMPAAEAIYTPFGFTRSWEWQWEEEAIRQSGTGKAEPVGEISLQQLADQVNARLASRFSMYAWRSPEYYRRLAAEQKACGGRLELLSYPADKDEVSGIAAESGSKIFCARSTARETYPPMMCRIIHLPSFLRFSVGKTPASIDGEPQESGAVPEYLCRGKDAAAAGVLQQKGIFRCIVSDPMLPCNNGIYEIDPVSRGGAWHRIFMPDARQQAAEGLPQIAVSDLPRLLGTANPFLHACICEVV